MRACVVLLMVCVSGAVMLGCSELREPTTVNPPPELSVHPGGWLTDNDAEFHGKFLRDHDWDLKGCQKCHGADYAGGLVGVSCLTCHPGTPEDCVVCHGGVDNLTGAPPRDVDGHVATSARGVGAHTRHLVGGELSAGFPCETCHVVPDSVAATGHLDSDLPAEVTFGGLAVAEEATPQWDGQSCRNTYCHGSFEGGIEDNAPIWTVVDGSQAACGTCHGLPPGGEHPQVVQCVFCHPVVVDSDNRITDKTRHLNGVVDFTQ